MRNFWVKRGEWVIGPVTDQQIRQMARQQWFRATDQIGIGEEGPWAAARMVVPVKGFNGEVTQRRESVLEPATSDSAPQSTSSHQSEAKARPRVEPDRVSGSAASDVASDSVPAWFRRGSEKGQSLPAEQSGVVAESGSVEEPSRPSEAVEPSAKQSPRGRDSSIDLPSVSEERSDHRSHAGRSAEEPSLVDDLYGDAPQVADDSPESAGRFPTADFDVVADDSGSGSV